MTEDPRPCPPAAGRELSDEELETQGKQLHDTRNWVFLHGTAAQFETHTRRMLELEQEYLRRFPKRTWQGDRGTTPTRSTYPPTTRWPRCSSAVADAPAAGCTSSRCTSSPGLVGLERAALARLYNGEPQLLATEKQDRVITDAGRARLAA